MPGSIITSGRAAPLLRRARVDKRKMFPASGERTLPFRIQLWHIGGNSTEVADMPTVSGVLESLGTVTHERWICSVIFYGQRFTVRSQETRCYR